MIAAEASAEAIGWATLTGVGTRASGEMVRVGGGGSGFWHWNSIIFRALLIVARNWPLEGG